MKGEIKNKKNVLHIRFKFDLNGELGKVDEKKKETNKRRKHSIKYFV